MYVSRELKSGDDACLSENSINRCHIHLDPASDLLSLELSMHILMKCVFRCLAADTLAKPGFPTRVRLALSSIVVNVVGLGCMHGGMCERYITASQAHTLPPV